MAAAVSPPVPAPTTMTSNASRSNVRRLSDASTVGVGSAAVSESGFIALLEFRARAVQRRLEFLPRLADARFHVTPRRVAGAFQLNQLLLQRLSLGSQFFEHLLGLNLRPGRLRPEDVDLRLPFLQFGLDLGSQLGDGLADVRHVRL